MQPAAEQPAKLGYETAPAAVNDRQRQHAVSLIDVGNVCNSRGSNACRRRHVVKDAVEGGVERGGAVGRKRYLQGVDSGVAARQRDLGCGARDKTLRSTVAARVFCRILLAVGTTSVLRARPSRWWLWTEDRRRD